MLFDLNIYAGYTNETGFSGNTGQVVQNSLHGYHLGLITLVPLPFEKSDSAKTITPVLGGGFQYTNTKGQDASYNTNVGIIFSSLTAQANGGIKIKLMPSCSLYAIFNYGLGVSDNFIVTYPHFNNLGNSLNVTDHSFYGITIAGLTAMTQNINLGMQIIYNKHTMILTDLPSLLNGTGLTTVQTSFGEISASIVSSLNF